ncbi:MAG TPA: major capsid protein [Pyrinomonadaceae bacterium]|nr:major capsid protein [Pyrinomonadaceae bacterium]
MSLVLSFPTNAELNAVVEAFVPDPAEFVGSTILPLTESMYQEVQWDERDRERGLTAPHLLGADPRVDTRQGSVRRSYTPIPFKESDLLKEDELLRARQLGTMAGTLDIASEIARLARNRWVKTMNRIEKLRWDALAGQITINEGGVSVSESFAVQSYTSATGWDTPTTATPLADFDAVKLLFRGTGASAAGAKAYMNQSTANLLLENQNSGDIKGFQNANFVQLPYAIDELNKILVARGLPTIVVVDHGYIDGSNAYKNFIKDGDVIVVGQRPAAQTVGDVVSTPSLHKSKGGQPAPGYFSVIEVNGVPSEIAGSVSLGQLGSGKNPKVEITGGIYGGPRLVYPKSVVKMAVYEA